MSITIDNLRETLETCGSSLRPKDFKMLIDYLEQSNIYPYTLPVATTSILGGVKIGNGITVTQDGTISSSGGIIDITYSELVSLINNSTLVKNQSYRIIDYQTIHYMLDGANRLADTNTGTIEPLIVTTASTNTLYSEAYSEIYPQDVIYYDWNPNNWLTDNGFSDGTTIISGYKGTIYRRVDTKLNNDVPFDFRNVKFRRWKYNYSQWDSGSTYSIRTYVSNSGDGIYISLKDNNVGNALGDINCWVNIINFSLTEYWAFQSSSSNNPTDYLDSYIFANYSNDETCGNIFESHSILGSHISSILNNTIFYGWTYYNTFGSNFELNTFGNNNTYNTFGNYNNSNTFGNDNNSNTFGNNNHTNTFGNNNYSNTFGNNNSNTFGNNNYSNTFGNDNNSNTFGNNNSNTFGNNNYSNTFGDGNYSNTFGDGNYSNTFGNDNNSNTFGDGNYSNTFGNSNTYNTFGNNNSNTFGHNNHTNTFGNYNNSNTFGNYNNSNTFRNNNSSITFGDGNYSNTFGNNNTYNTFGNNNSNTFGHNNHYNTFGNYNNSNTFGNSNFSINIGMISISNITFKNGYNGNGVDFSGVTHLSSGCECEIFKASNGNYYLKYFDGTTEQYVAPNS